MECHFEQRRKQRMNLFGWRKKKIADKTTNLKSLKEEKNICPECRGQGYTINDDSYFVDHDDYESGYSCCRRCNGTGYYHSNIDSY